MNLVGPLRGGCGFEAFVRGRLLKLLKLKVNVLMDGKVVGGCA